MESLNGFVVFVQVAEMRSFVAAGRNLGVSASAVGKSIARLEDKLGVRLFHRSTRSITLTAEGHLLLERSRRILAEIEAAQQELTQAAEHPVGRLRLSLPLVGSLVLPVLGDFMRQYPQIQLDLEFTDRMVDVIAEGYDAVLRIGPPADSRLSARKLGHFRTVVVASPEYLARCGEPQTPADLTRHACLQYRFPSSGKLERWVMRGNEAENELALPATMVCNNIETRVCFALRGLGIAWLPDFAIREALEERALREVLADYASHTGVVHLLWPASKHPSPKLRVLIDFLSTRLFPPAK
ncbi:LysR substrate-binding domain-containing protein [Phytobacter diazotrophicus]|uniref:LysR substrate-binding domain-containing protein n=1 Tax=Phytobacter diazotrophicus TaxID=395631 RepID=UPI001451419C|nr:LysR substrate-binding domain-containing protein [Phytobacter diazotrophicus]QJF18945.1 LysR family transcriptional regulator [Phytobacter diazotrophicus]